MGLINRFSIALVIITSFLILVPALARADCTSCGSTQSAIQCGVNSAASGDCNTKPTGDLNTTVKDIVTVLSVLVGVAAVIMIIIAGLRYVTSAGSAEGAKSARNMLLYAIIGLVIVALAQIIVHFVLNQTSTGTTNGNTTNSSNSSGTLNSGTGSCATSPSARCQ
ncbi:MAG: pilin [Candidatus Saccharimonadales bacterium]